MKLFKYILVLLIISTGTVTAQVNPKLYTKAINKERRVKDKTYKNSDESPLTPEGKKKFKQLAYFLPDTGYVIQAKLEKISSPDTIKMKTTTERLPLYFKYGIARFTLNGKEQSLTVFQNIGLMKKEGYEDYLFIPFTDESNGESTYGGGRYIDTRITSDSTILIDFNRAYNPYCVYNKKYSCPIPPGENHITTEVLSGEKNFK